MKELNQSSKTVKNEYLYDLLERIKKRPGMYLGKPSITRLNMLLTGYSMARIELDLPPTKQEEEFGGFQDWIEERYKITSTHGWDSIILFYSADERDALSNFFQLFEQFCNGESASRSPSSSENTNDAIPQLTQKVSK